MLSSSRGFLLNVIQLGEQRGPTGSPMEQSSQATWWFYTRNVVRTAQKALLAGERLTSIIGGRKMPFGAVLTPLRLFWRSRIGSLRAQAHENVLYHTLQQERLEMFWKRS